MRIGAALIILLLALSLAVMTVAAGSPEGSWGVYPSGGSHGVEDAVPAQPPALTRAYYVELIGNYVAAGTSLRNEPWDTITITGIPSGATVVKAFLIWSIMDDSIPPATIAVNGTPFTGTIIKVIDSAAYCWGATYDVNYIADVTSVVTGNGVYNISGYPTGITDFSDPWAEINTPLAEGASLIVIYSHPSEKPRAIVVAVGNEPASFERLIMWDTPAASPVEAKNTWIAIDGQMGSYAEQDQAVFNGVVVAGPGTSIRPDDAFPGADHRTGAASYGSLWDTLTVDVSSLVSPGDTEATIGMIVGDSDCIGLAADVFSVTIPRSSVVGGSLELEGQYSYDVLIPTTLLLAVSAILILAAGRKAVRV